MQNYILVNPRFSDFNGQGLLKASIHLDLACEAQLVQMSSRYKLPLTKFTTIGLRWHIADFNISFPYPIRTLEPLRIEADVVQVDDQAMVVDFIFFDEHREKKFAFGSLRFELVGPDDLAVKIPSDVRDCLAKFGRIA